MLLPALVVSLLARWRPGGALARRPGRAAAARAAATLPAALYAVLALDYALADHSVLARPFELERREDAFVLRVRYGAPDDRPASCEFSSRTRRWHCSGR